jgi:hypothetical protein
VAGVVSTRVPLPVVVVEYAAADERVGIVA